VERFITYLITTTRKIIWLNEKQENI